MLRIRPFHYNSQQYLQTYIDKKKKLGRQIDPVYHGLGQKGASFGVRVGTQSSRGRPRYHCEGPADAYSRPSAVLPSISLRVELELLFLLRMGILMDDVINQSIN